MKRDRVELLCVAALIVMFIGQVVATVAMIRESLPL